MTRMVALFAVLVGVLGLHCSGGGGDEELSPEQKRQKVRDEGIYCCTHDGTPTPTSSAACTTKPGAVYLLDFESVDASGRGDACGWISNR